MEQAWGLRRSLLWAADSVLASYSEILFCRSRAVGVLLLGATLVVPAAGLFGLAAVLVSMLAARAFSFPLESVRAGLFGYNAMLVGLGIGALYVPGPASIALVCAGAVLAVLVTATMNSALGSAFNLPSLTLPFLFVFYLVLLVAPVLAGLEVIDRTYDPVAAGEGLPQFLATYLRSLGALFFSPRIESGLLVLAALLVFSRIATVLSLLAFAAVYAAVLGLVQAPDAPLLLSAGFNLMWVAIALGGVWFVPQLSSFLFALATVAVGVLVTLGLRGLLDRLGLPLLILPFNLIILPMLYGMRQRVRDGKPKAVDFALGTPEQNLRFYQTRLARFGYPYLVRFGLPLLGRWTVTQGNDGEHTHKGLWRHGLDFEVFGTDDLPYSGDGSKVEDYRCFKAPVVAPAYGTVVKVVNDVPDNAIGEVNTKENWGNLVLLYHAPGLYSLCAHLVRGSVQVSEGAVVHKGAQLGRCGNSGRSPSPHLHFQLQGTSRIGAPTMPVSFYEIVSVETGAGAAADGNGPEDGAERLEGALTPRELDVVRNVKRDPVFEGFLSFPIGGTMTFKVAWGGGAFSEESVSSELDLYGNLMLVSNAREAVLFYENKNSTFTIYDYIGPAKSVLGLLAQAVPRAPLEMGRSLTWNDQLVSRYFRPGLLRVLSDFVSPFMRPRGVEMGYSAQLDGARLTVSGVSKAALPGGAPLFETRAVFEQGQGLLEVTCNWKGRVSRATRQEKEKQ